MGKGNTSNRDTEVPGKEGQLQDQQGSMQSIPLGSPPLPAGLPTHQ